MQEGNLSDKFVREVTSTAIKSMTPMKNHFFVISIICFLCLAHACRNPKELNLPNFEKERWRQDSFGRLGYRAQYVLGDSLFAARLEGITYEELIRVLGPPNEEGNGYGNKELLSKYHLTAKVYDYSCKYYWLFIILKRGRVKQCHLQYSLCVPRCG